MTTFKNETAAPAFFARFCETAESIGATTKRLEKAALLGAFFDELSDEDLLVAARYFGGALFSRRGTRANANVGGAALLAAIAGACNAPDDWLRTRLVQRGDHGEVAFDAMSEYSRDTKNAESALLLQNVASAFEELSQTRGSKKKVELLTQLLGRATPLEAKYIVKLGAGDLRIGLKEGAVEDAVARATEVPVARIQWTNMLTGDIGETALLARHDKLDEAQMRLLHPIKFMLASPIGELEEVEKQMPDGFFVEDKFDGIRAQAHIAPPNAARVLAEEKTPSNESEVALFSRTLDDITGAFPDLQKAFSTLLSQECDGLILDGEIVPISADGARVLPFQSLQKRLGRKVLTEAILRETPVAFVAYDVLFARSKVLVNETLQSRRAILEALPLQETGVLRVTKSTFLRADQTDLLDDEFANARARGNEGLMLKDPRATYKPGRRGREWLKLKRALATLDVVVTAAEVGSGRRSRFLSDYTFAVRAGETDATLLNVGKAYSGLTDPEVEELSQWFRAHTIAEFAHGKVRTVEPKIVLEVTFDRVQKSARHKSGYALRFPRILRVRNDKPVEEIDTLESVRRLAEDAAVESE